MTRSAAQVVFGPVISERSYALYERGRYTFRVAKDASKPEIARALEDQYQAQGIKVVDVNTIRVGGKKRGGGRRAPEGRTSDWKKAIVTLRSGQRLEGLFGGV